jgi:ribosomal protein S18 acetylase RimI-like enzyme
MANAALHRGSIDDIESLRPLWISMHHHHAGVMPELSPYVEDGETWAIRRAHYEALLVKPETILLLAQVHDALIGYGLAHVVEARSSWTEDTWRTDERIGEIESLAVLPAHRGEGIGTQLLEGLERALAGMGIHDLVVGALSGNAGAIRLYERRGFRQTYTYLSRFHDRPTPG